MKKGWRETTLGEIIRSGGGKIQTGPFGSQLHASDYVEQGIPCIMPANMKDNRVETSGIARISVDDANRLSQHIVQEGDIVYSRRGDVTQKALIRKNEVGYFCGTGCLLVRPGKDLDSNFLTYHLSAPANKSWIIQQAVGATMPSLNTSILSEIPLNVPDLETQKRIASVLSSLDAKIELNNRINAELEAMAKALYDYWFVQFDFPNAKGKPYKSSGGKMVWNEELKREIPVGWEAGILDDIIEKTGTGLNPRNNFQLGEGEMFYITIKDIEQGKINISDKTEHVTEETLRIIDRRSDLQAGDVLFTSIQPVGLTYLLQDKPTIWNINESVFTIRPNQNKVTSEYLFMLLSSRESKAYYANTSAGSIHKGIRHSVLREMQICIPDYLRIKLFTDVLSPVLKKVSKVHTENSVLEEQRNFLLPMLMNGQVTVA